MYEDVVSVYFEMMQNLLVQPAHSFADSQASVPSAPGVYIVYDNSREQIVYVGRTKNLRRRLLSDHKRGNIEGSQFRKALGQTLSTTNEKAISEYISKNCRFQFLIIPSFQETVRFEHFATAILAPILNVQLKQ